jgi:hypothetical protein
LPSTGWKQVADNGARFYRVAGDLKIPFRHFEFTHPALDRPQFAHAFFCVREDWIRSNVDRDSEEVSGEAGGWSIADRWRVVREGVRNLGQQVMEFVVVSSDASAAHEAEAKFATLAAQLVQVTPEK